MTALPPTEPDPDPDPSAGDPTADPLHLLLEIQDLDVAADQLRHRRETLPERARLVTAQAAIADHEASLVELRTDRQAHLDSQRRAEDEIEGLAERAEAEERKLYGGGITAVREVDAIQAELGSLSRHRSDLEDRALADMEAVDELGQAVTEEERSLARREQEVVELIGVVGGAEAAIDGELGANVGVRASLASRVPAELLATYERLRARLGGVAVARFEGGHCLGCHLALPATEVDRLRRAPVGAIVTHEECGRILVR
jgi:predicted  nucleic acid-binding Zn-ribbon protein